jgi:hypothetical protein
VRRGERNGDVGELYTITTLPMAPSRFFPARELKTSEEVARDGTRSKSDGLAVKYV